MRLLRDGQSCVLPSCPPTTQHNLEDLGKLWAEWGIHGLILVSFGLQVFLFFAARFRRRITWPILRSLLWLAYLSADSVAIFILGHLSVHASGPRHQLLFFWAPFVLLHLGGQHTITAFAMQDNELWMRHLLGLVTQVVVAGYVVSRSSWSDRRLLAAMVLMFLSGCLRYAERTLCLYNASPAKLKESSLRALSDYAEKVERGNNKDRSYRWNRFRKEDIEDIPSAYASKSYKKIIDRMLEADGRRLSWHSPGEISSSAAALVSETPLGDLAAAEALPSDIQHKLILLKSSEDRCRAYNYVGTRLVHIYELLYTKAPLHFIFLDSLVESCNIGALILPILPARCFCYCLAPLIGLSYLFDLLAFSLLVLFPSVSTLATLVLFVAAEKSQLYNQADVIVSYILLIGALTLEVASLFITFALSQEAPHRIQSAMWSVTKYIHPAWGSNQWSEMIGQYNMIKSVTKQDDAGIMSFVPKWIGKYLYDKTITHIRIYEDLKKFVLDKLLEFGTRQEDWNFASYRGQIALRDRKSTHRPFSVFLTAKSETSLLKSIDDMDFPTTVLIWHIATDILYFQDNGTNSTSSHQETKKMSRELSNYIMYLVFKCGVMITNTTELQHNNALKVMEDKRDLGEKGAMEKVFEANKHRESTSKSPIHPLLPNACKVAKELIDIHGETHRWDLIAAVWLEMLFYIAPRCGGAFHSEHLATGGEFITHVLLLMQLLGPFLKPVGTK